MAEKDSHDRNSTFASPLLLPASHVLFSRTRCAFEPPLCRNAVASAARHSILFVCSTPTSRAKNGKGTKNIGGIIWGRTAGAVTEKLLLSYDPNHFSEFPTVWHWRKRFIGGNATGSRMDIHHVVEEYVLEQLLHDKNTMTLVPIPRGDGTMINVPLHESGPGVALPTTFKDLEYFNKDMEPERHLPFLHEDKANGGISGILQEYLPTGDNGIKSWGDPNDIVRELRKALHDPRGPGNPMMWPLARDFLRKLLADGKLDPDIVHIPD